MDRRLTDVPIDPRPKEAYLVSGDAQRSRRLQEELDDKLSRRASGSGHLGRPVGARPELTDTELLEMVRAGFEAAGGRRSRAARRLGLRPEELERLEELLGVSGDELFRPQVGWPPPFRSRPVDRRGDRLFEETRHLAVRSAVLPFRPPPLYCLTISRSSTSKIRVEPGLITPAPLSP